jgi:hypothetical protein
MKKNHTEVEEWMSMNLAETKYNDLTDIVYGQDVGIWTSNVIGAYCYHTDWI